MTTTTVQPDPQVGAPDPSPARDADALTIDGKIVRIRAATPGDRAGLTSLYLGASPNSLRMRFFNTPSPATIEAEVERLCEPNGPDRCVVLAELAGTVVGVASYERLRPGAQRAEFAVLVADPARGNGIGTLLVEFLAADARGQGISEITGAVLSVNTRMLQVARDLASDSRTGPDFGVVDVSMATTGGEAALLAIDGRERLAEQASLRPVLAPDAVAVVAAVPAPAVAGVVEQAAQVGARGVVVLGSGFGEAGPEGRRRQAELVRVARRHGIRLVGPNCIGVINTDPAVRLDASFVPGTPRSGGLAVASQSGAVGIAVLAEAARVDCGVSTFVSLGNKADISGNDLIAYWYDDPSTRAVALYLESFGNPRKFARTVRALSRRKPVIAVKSGRSAAGRRAGASHTAAAAAPDATVAALFAQAGVIRADSLGDLVDASRMVTDQALPAGGRLGVLGNAGGLNVLAVDAAEGSDLIVPEPSDELRALVAAAALDLPGYDNPLDLGAAATPERFAAAAEAMASSGEIDMLLLIVVATRANDTAAALGALADVVDRHPQITVAAVLVDPADTPVTLGTRRAPVFDLPERAIRALDHAARYASWRRQPLGSRPLLSFVDSELARTAVSAALATEGGWQPPAVIDAILRAYGLPVVTSTLVTDGDAAAEAAREIGYPVVVKSADPELVHKTDVGAVRVNLADEESVRAAYAAVTAAGNAAAGALVQPMAAGAVELVVGINHDPVFGSVVVAGLGGVLTDILHDHALGLVPMTDLDAKRMWRSLRGAPLLTGFRGSSPVDIGAVEDLLMRVGRMAEELPEIAELDLNPVKAGPDGVLVVDAKMRLRRVDDEPDPALRRLR